MDNKCPMLYIINFIFYFVIFSSDQIEFTADKFKFVFSLLIHVFAAGSFVLTFDFNYFNISLKNRVWNYSIFQEGKRK